MSCHGGSIGWRLTDTRWLCCMLGLEASSVGAVMKDEHIRFMTVKGEGGWSMLQLGLVAQEEDGMVVGMMEDNSD